MADQTNFGSFINNLAGVGSVIGDAAKKSKLAALLRGDVRQSLGDSQGQLWPSLPDTQSLIGGEPLDEVRKKNLMEQMTGKVMGVMPMGVGAIRGMGYKNAPDWAMGFRKNGPQKEWGDQNYKFVQDVEVRWPDGMVIIDAQKGLNAPHALERARRNWEGATITPLTKEEAALRESLIGHSKE